VISSDIFYKKRGVGKVVKRFVWAQQGNRVSVKNIFIIVSGDLKKNQMGGRGESIFL
jgi:hypothetical protein